MSSVFLETSALLRMLFREGKAGVVVKRLKSADRILSSRLLRVEAERTLIRLGLDHPDNLKFLQDLERELKNFWPRVDFIEVTREICDLAGRLAPLSRVRTLDAIHVATYYRVREFDPSIEMLTFDKKIAGELV